MVHDAGKFLDNLTEETGGRVIFANSNQDLEATFTKRSRSFAIDTCCPTRHRCLATGWHRLEVKLKTKSGTVTARRGYFAE